MTQFRKALECFFEESRDTKSLRDPKYFFDKWFLDQGKGFYFSFRRGLNVTNVQFAELISLVRTNLTIHQSEDCINSIQFFRFDDYMETVRKLFTAFFEEGRSKEKIVRSISEYYESVFSGIIVIDTFLSSCALFLPPGMDINLINLCASSGYVQSCGNLVFHRKISKVTEQYFAGKLDRYFRQSRSDSDVDQLGSSDIGSSKMKIVFKLHCYEDYGPKPAMQEDYLVSSHSDDLKFFADKIYIDNQPLASFLWDLKHSYGSRLMFPDLGENIDRDSRMKSTIWLVSDRLLSDNSTKSQREMFLICYEQLYSNQNPVFEFDENMPGWIDHTTIPHTLVSAMLNIGISINNAYSGNQEEIHVLDPFVGSGTTLIETLKHQYIKFFGSDLSSIAKQVCEDNIEFFGYGKSELLQLSDQLTMFEQLISQNDYFSDYGSENMLETHHKIGMQNLSVIDSGSIRFVDECFRNALSFQRKSSESILNSSNVSADLQTFLERFFYYLLLKCEKRYSSAIARKTIDMHAAISGELTQFISGLRQLVRDRNEVYRHELEATAFLEFESSYSRALTINRKIYTCSPIKDNIKSTIAESSDALDSLSKLKSSGQIFDIVLTDPPYGFNTKENIPELARLYSMMIDKMLDILNPNFGQLILFLPAISNTGRKLHYFTQKEIVVNQIIEMASSKDMIPISPARVLPKPSWLFKPPYYWESEKSLRRSILHFTFQKLN